MKIHLLLLCYIIISPIIYGQSHFDCATINQSNNITPKSLSCIENSLNFNNQYRHKETYIPSVGSKEDFIKTIHVSFHIWQRADGSGSLDDNQNNRARLRLIANWLAGFYTYNDNNTLPVPYSTQLLADTKFRLILDSIYFYNDNTIDSTYFYCNGDIGHNTKLDNYLKNNYPERIKSLSLHLVNGYYSTAGGYSHNGSVLSFYRTSPDMNTNDIHDWWYAKHLFHEIGHGLDLAHTYDYYSNSQNCNQHQLDFLWDVYDTTAISPCSTQPSCEFCSIPGNSISNDIMSGSGDAGFKSALQIGIMHRSAILENRWNYGYNIRDHIVGYNPIPFEINQNETWDFSMKMYQDLVVKTGVTLTVKCILQFVPEARVIIEPGGKLILDGGKFTNENYYNSFWQGIEVWGTSNQHQYPLNNSQYQGTLILKNGGTIENAHTAVTNWKREDWNGIGGIIQATDGVFRNNRRDVEFMSYSNFLASNPNAIVPNLSFFRNTDFVSDDNFIEKGYGIQKHVTLWEVSGINFTNCHFTNAITTNKNNSSAPNGAISSLNAGFRVLAGCSTTLPLGQACPTSNLLKSSFSGLLKAVEIAGTSTTKAVTVQQSKFINNVHGITVDEFDNVSINRNEIEIGNAGYVYTWPNIFAGSGVNLTNSTGYIIEENNIFTNLTYGINSGINVNKWRRR
jgi:hypothetical protein